MGTASGAFNAKKAKSFFKQKREKKREKRKRVGTKEKHVAVAVKAVSGTRTKKHQRKVAHKQRLAEKETQALESMMEVDAGKVPASGSKKALKMARRTAAKRKSGKGAGGPSAQQAQQQAEVAGAEAMQE